MTTAVLLYLCLHWVVAARIGINNPKLFLLTPVAMAMGYLAAKFANKYEL